MIFTVLLAVMCALMLIIFLLRRELKDLIKNTHSDLYLQLYSEDILNQSKSIVLFKFIHFNDWQDLVGQDKIKKVIKKLKLFEVTYYLNFILLITLFFLYL